MNLYIDMARVKQGDHTVLPATHTRTIPAFNNDANGSYATSYA